MGDGRRDDVQFSIKRKKSKKSKKKERREKREKREKRREKDKTWQAACQ